MSTPQPTSPEPSTLRVVGLTLLGLAAIALIIGLLTILGGNGDGVAEPTPTTSGQPGSSDERPPPSSSSGTATSKPSESSGAATTTTTPPGESSAATPPPGGDGNGEPGKAEPVRVYNNSTISGLANQAAADLRAVGWNVVEVGNYPSGTIPTTTAYYRPGTAEQEAAEDIADDFGMRVEKRFTGLGVYPAGVIVIVTNDYQGVGGKNEGK
jgi:LytR cell envelope-related transcriptional attenuator